MTQEKARKSAKINQNEKEERGVFKMENELFEKTKVSKAYMTLALPVVLGMVVSLIYNMVHRADRKHGADCRRIARHTDFHADDCTR